MNGYEYILSKQTAWATNSGISLVGSKGKRGRPAYTCELNHNLFQPLLPDVRESFASGDGGELGSTEFPGKMQAVHSSSALGVNVFQYWKSIRAVDVIAAQCGLCRVGSRVSCDIHFEEKYPINDTFGYHPNIDVVCSGLGILDRLQAFISGYLLRVDGHAAACPCGWVLK